MHDWLTPQWPAAARVKSCVTSRTGGVSVAPYASFNLGDHVGDDPRSVAKNRERLVSLLGCQPAWLQQVHGTAVAEADPTQVVSADASCTSQRGVACAVLTADCLPVLFCDRAGTRVGAAHAGWRGLAGGVLEATVAQLDLPAENVLAWLGPAIGNQAFEVGPEVREAFISQHAAAREAFVPSNNAGKFIADIYQLARIRLAAQGIIAVYGGGLCTYNDPRFYSYRRAAQTGRFASLIWLVD
ncbi:peptidoglycan editing factor PgeF [Pseudomonas sp. 5P_3.1_Bac2]|uniref:peptidoglycan editing factor PgeF n=1 Tax=Pseudomonas sp. 5P_3.1_Bac2 TaxID=2971617 RepID=UPI0021C737B5|nr:peptidoglycan editing factor PgeF [Pseudomonas sp. 5P_3.1_Bac2]MCU1718144.1 peptidoglycan editing factor PgeF [Pseudomonas sp. 5P_3.1_Bac2]